MKAGLVISKLLENDANVSALVVDRIYPLDADTDENKPFIIYGQTEVNPTDTKDSSQDVDYVEVRIMCVATTYATMVDLSAKVRDALDRKSNSDYGVYLQSIRFDRYDEFRDRENKVYFSHSFYECRILNN